MKKIVSLVFCFMAFSLMAQEEKLETVPFAMIEEVPVYPGCEMFKGGDERKRCFNKKVTQYVARHFNSDIATECFKSKRVYDEKEKIYKTECIEQLESGRHSIMIKFKIDEEGYVDDIHVKAPHSRLKEEGKRIAMKLPKMLPGKQRGRAIRVQYVLPIRFIVE